MIPIKFIFPDTFSPVSLHHSPSYEYFLNCRLVIKLPLTIEAIPFCRILYFKNLKITESIDFLLLLKWDRYNISSSDQQVTNRY